jgi:hypothetical protein
MAGAAMPLVKMDEVLGLMRYCFGCDEWWPSDDDFWRPFLWSRRAVCRACADEGRRRSTREASRRYRSKLNEGQAA